MNLGRVQSDINALWSIAPHDISIVLPLLGVMPLEVSARGAGFLNSAVEDVVFMTLSSQAMCWCMCKPRGLTQAKRGA